MQVISPSWTAMTSTSPATPGRMKASQTGQPALSVPAVIMTRCSPNRVVSRRAIRAPIRPPTHGAANARPYCHGAKCSWPSMSTAISGSVARIRPPTRIELASSGRSVGWARVYRHPSSRSAARSRAAPARSGCASCPPMAVMPAADSR